MAYKTVLQEILERSTRSSDVQIIHAISTGVMKFMGAFCAFFPKEEYAKAQDGMGNNPANIAPISSASAVVNYMLSDDFKEYAEDEKKFNEETRFDSDLEGLLSFLGFTAGRVTAVVSMVNFDNFGKLCKAFQKRDFEKDKQE